MQRSLLQAAVCANGPVPGRQRLGVRTMLSMGRASASLGASCGCRATEAPGTAFLGRGAAAGVSSGVRQRLRTAPTRGVSGRSVSRVTARAGDGPDAVDRVAGAVPYLVPLFDSLKYGVHLATSHCAAVAAISPLNHRPSGGETATNEHASCIPKTGLSHLETQPSS
jgi:hypothetical protein